MFGGRRTRATTALPNGRFQRRGAGMPAMVVADASIESIQQAMGGALGGQVTVGGVAGFATGYAVKRIGQVLLVIVGLEVVALQMMSRRGWVSVDWKAISDEVSPHVEKERMERAFDAVKYKMPFAGAFGAGCAAGLKWG